MSKTSRLVALVGSLLLAGAASAQVSLVLTTEGGVEKTCTTIGNVVVASGQISATVPDNCLTVESGGGETPSNYSLTVTKTGSGTISSSPSGINCGSGSGCSASFANASSVTLTATPASGWNFSGWTNCSPADNPVCSVTMGSNRSVVASFTQQVGGGDPGGGVGGSDPGTGSWSPDLSANPRIIAVNQSGGAGDATTILPGCANGGSIAMDAACRSNTTYMAFLDGISTPVKLTKGQIISVRYEVSGTTLNGSTGAIKLTNSVGGGTGYVVKASLSPTPGDMAGNGNARRCVVESAAGPSIATGTGTFECKIDRTKSRYYLNIEVQRECADCILYVVEGSSEFK